MKLEAGWAPERLWMFWRKISSPCQDKPQLIVIKLKKKLHLTKIIFDYFHGAG
jgi:hypothetical protein